MTTSEAASANSGATLIRTAAIIGGGVIGSGWAARFLLNGWDVRFFDPSADAERILHAVIERGREAMPALCDSVPAEGCLYISESTAEAVAEAVYVQEYTPGRIEVKGTVMRKIQTRSSHQSTCLLARQRRRPRLKNRSERSRRLSKRRPSGSRHSSCGTS